MKYNQGFIHLFIPKHAPSLYFLPLSFPSPANPMPSSWYSDEKVDFFVFFLCACQFEPARRVTPGRAGPSGTATKHAQCLCK